MIDIPVSRPLLPAAAHLLRYLERLDRSRRYSNRGDLVVALEARLQATLGLSEALVATTASGTAALQAAILAGAGRPSMERPVALVAGYTFAATPLAAEACGYEVEFVDLAQAGWCIDPDVVRAHPSFARCGLVLPVAPYGAAFRQQPWAEFMRSSGVPVVIDAAAGFDAVRADPTGTTGDVPVALSFHATKAFSTGEGGAVVWSDLDGLARVAQACNFGILHVRETRVSGFNGKMSEYHAAVGLASLDEIAERDRRHEQAASVYSKEASRAGIDDHLIVAPAIAPCYALFDARTGERAVVVRDALQRDGIDTRLWYGRGAHCEPYFRRRRAAALLRTEAVAERLVGVPIFPDMGVDEITRVCASLAAADATSPQAE